MNRIRNIYSLQVFEAVARLGSVSRAAAELNLSQSSASYHIKKIEDFIGVALFERTGGGLLPTAEGTVLAAHVRRGLATIGTGIEKVTSRTAALRVAVLPMFASRWLSARLGGFWEAHPRVQLSFQNHNNAYVRLERPEAFADLGIQWGRGDWSAFHVTRLWFETLAVVCSPAYLAANPIREPADLARCTLIHVDDERMWAEWFRTNGLEPAPTQAAMVLEDRHFQLSSTVNGLGVSLFAACMVREELRSGALVNPFGRLFDTAFAYHLVVPRDAVPTPEALHFRNWLLEICRAEQEIGPAPAADAR